MNKHQMKMDRLSRRAPTDGYYDVRPALKARVGTVDRAVCKAGEALGWSDQQLDAWARSTWGREFGIDHDAFLRGLDSKEIRSKAVKAMKEAAEGLHEDGAPAFTCGACAGLARRHSCGLKQLQDLLRF